MLHGREQQRKDDARRAPDAVREFCLGAHLNAPRLLRVTDAVIVRLHIRDVAERERHGIGARVRNADVIHGGGEFTGVRGHHEDKDRRHDREILDQHIKQIKQLLPGDGMSRKQRCEHCLCAVNLRPLVGRKEEDRHQVDHHEEHDELEYRADLSPLRPRHHVERGADCNHHEEHPRVIGECRREAPHNEKDQLGDARKMMQPCVLFLITQQSVHTITVPPAALSIGISPQLSSLFMLYPLLFFQQRHPSDPARTR